MKKILFSLLFIGSLLTLNACTNTKSNQTEKAILFFGSTCPHCVNVEEYINTNNISAKLNFDKLEVFNDTNNAALMAEKAKTCGLDTKTIGVPFFWTGSNCLLGDVDIINYFKNLPEPNNTPTK